MAHNPGLHATVVDRAEPLTIAKEVVASSGLEDRVHLVTGDFYETELATDHDVVLISGVVLIKSEVQCRELFRRAKNALLGDGILIVQDFMTMDDSAERRGQHTLMDLYVLVGYGAGASTRTSQEVAGWIAEDGFVDVETIAVPSQLHLVTCRKPA